MLHHTSGADRRGHGSDSRIDIRADARGQASEHGSPGGGLSDGRSPLDGRELRKLKRAELLEIMLAQSEEIDRLRAELAQKDEQLRDRQIAIQGSGSIAEASLKLTQVFQEAQKAADIYLSNVQRLAGRAPAGATAAGRPPAGAAAAGRANPGATGAGRQAAGAYGQRSQASYQAPSAGQPVPRPAAARSTGVGYAPSRQAAGPSSSSSAAAAAAARQAYSAGASSAPSAPAQGYPASHAAASAQAAWGSGSAAASASYPSAAQAAQRASQVYGRAAEQGYPSRQVSTSPAVSARAAQAYAAQQSAARQSAAAAQARRSLDDTDAYLAVIQGGPGARGASQTGASQAGASPYSGRHAARAASGSGGGWAPGGGS